MTVAHEVSPSPAGRKSNVVYIGPESPHPNLDRVLSLVDSAITIVRELVPNVRTTQKARILRAVGINNGTNFALRMLAEAARSGDQGRGLLQPMRITKVKSNNSLQVSKG